VRAWFGTSFEECTRTLWRGEQRYSSGHDPLSPTFILTSIRMVSSPRPGPNPSLSLTVPLLTANLTRLAPSMTKCVKPLSDLAC
jgi:hypothetical protein